MKAGWIDFGATSSSRSFSESIAWAARRPLTRDGSESVKFYQLSGDHEGAGFMWFSVQHPARLAVASAYRARVTSRCIS